MRAGVARLPPPRIVPTHASHPMLAMAYARSPETAPAMILAEKNSDSRHCSSNRVWYIETR